MRPVLAVLLLLGAAPAGAAELAVGPDSVEIHGFVSQGFLWSTENDYLADSEEGSFELSEVGVNVTASLTESLRVGIQLFARDLGPVGDYEPQMDWYYLDYRWADWLGVRAGRIKVPFGLYNEINDVDQARVPALLPQSIYPAANRDFLLAQTGVEAYGRLDVGGGALEYRLYGGTLFFEVDPASTPYEVEKLSVPYLVGGRLLWEPPLEGLRVGGSVQALRLDTVLGASGMIFTADLPAVLWVASAEYARDDLLVAAEYSRWHVDVETSNPALFPARDTVSERAYALAAYRVNGWLQPAAYYSIYFRDVDDRSGREQYQHDAALTLRFDINPHWLVKLEGHFLYGTAALSANLNGGTPPRALAREWGLFLIKTTAYF